MERTLPPMNFTDNLAVNWQIWKQRFQTYLIASETNTKEEAVQCAQLLHFMGEEALHIYNTFTIADNERNKIAVLLEKFDNYFIPKTNVTYERYKFVNLRQTPQESIEQFTTQLKNQANKCEFGNLKDDMVKTILISGIQDEILREKLLYQQNKNLQDVIEACILWENTKLQSQDMQKQVHEIQQKRGTTFSHKMQPRSTTTVAPKVTRHQQAVETRVNRSVQDRFITNCNKCGKSHKINNCPAYEKICNFCKKLNHFSVVCKAKLRKSLHEVNTKQENDNKIKFSIDSVNYKNNSWTVNLQIHNINLIFKVDTGADVNIMSLQTVRTVSAPFRRTRE